MKNDIDSVSAELTQELAFSPLEKMLPPKLRYRYYKWLKQFRGSSPSKSSPDQVQKTIEKAYEHIEAVKTLKKNEVMASFYESGAIRMDFGSDVDPKVKEAAMKWAKRRGLRASEASLDKSADAPSYVVYSAPFSEAKGLPAKYLKYST
jgi:hypothetical protein